MSKKYAATALPRSVMAAGAVFLAVHGCASKKVLTAGQCDPDPVVEAQKASVDGPALVPMVKGSTRAMPLNSVNLTDKNITHKVVVHSTGGERSGTGALQAWGRFVNCTDYDLALEGRTHFFGADNQEVEAPTAWTSLFLPARSTGIYNAVSARKDARRYLIEVREK